MGLRIGKSCEKNAGRVTARSAIRIDEYRRDAVRKLEHLRAAHAQHGTISTSLN